MAGVLSRRLTPALDPIHTRAGTITRPTIARIDAALSLPRARDLYGPGDIDKLLDARLILMAARDGEAQR